MKAYSSLYNQVFFLEKSMFSRVVCLVNEPDPWASPCIVYENRGFWAPFVCYHIF